MTFKLGLTGSIGMGKSTTAKLFAEEGCDVWDADAAVHRLYSKGGLAVEPLRHLLPEAIEDGAVSRENLKTLLKSDPNLLKEIERIVHPLVAQDRAECLEHTKADICVLDIPLLFETGSDKSMDATICVTVDLDIQKARVLERGTMTEDQLDTILANQMPDEEKRARADFVITTDTLEHARAQVQDIVSQIRASLNHA
ncbi:dephospho-CoA kinase [Roseovarius phycicola]|uniref:Dephospho-CoA kinase n=1 Tax=Roseovarius phycicola TaxID=3080976 RepID=A0ABZ2HFG6_9RHOB